MKYLFCEQCKKEVVRRKNCQRFCSRKCYFKSGLMNKTMFKSGHKKLGDNSGEKNGSWKGDKIGYWGIHSWIESKLGKPKRCSHCGTESITRYEWANISRKYKRDINDWMRLCCLCHRRYDRGQWVAQPVKI